LSDDEKEAFIEEAANFMRTVNALMMVAILFCTILLIASYQ